MLNRLFNILFQTTIFILFITSSSLAAITIHPFINSNEEVNSAFTNKLQSKINELSETFNATAIDQDRYECKGKVIVAPSSISYNAVLIDKYQISQDVNLRKIIRKKKGLDFATAQLAQDILKTITQNKITHIEIEGNNRTSNILIENLANIHKGDIATPTKIISGQIRLSTSDLFKYTKIQIVKNYTDTTLKIKVIENNTIVLPEFKTPSSDIIKETLQAPAQLNATILTGPSLYRTNNSPESIEEIVYNCYEAFMEFQEGSNKYTPLALEKLMFYATKIHNTINLSDQLDDDLYVILFDICSTLDSKVIKHITTTLENRIAYSTYDESILEESYKRIDSINQFYAISSETMNKLAKQIYDKNPSDLELRWIFKELAKRAFINEETAKAALLMSSAIGLSPLPVSADLLASYAYIEYSNLNLKEANNAKRILEQLNTTSNNLYESELQNLNTMRNICMRVLEIGEEGSFDEKLEKGYGLIVLNRPDLAEPLFHDLHSLKPNDARPFTGFAKLAYQRTDLLESIRPYIEQGLKLKNKDADFYEIAIAYKLQKLTKEALPAIRIKGRNSEEASAARFVLPKVLELLKNYKKFDPPKSEFLISAATIFNNWLSYPAMENEQAFDSLFNAAQELRKKYTENILIANACNYFSRFSLDSLKANEALLHAGPQNADQNYYIILLTSILSEMGKNPTEELANQLVEIANKIAPKQEDRESLVALQADAYALSGLFFKNKDILKKSSSMYELALNISDDEKSREKNNLAVVNLALGNKEKATEIFSDLYKTNHIFAETSELGKILTTVEKDKQKEALTIFIKNSYDPQIKSLVNEFLTNSTIDKNTIKMAVNKIGKVTLDYNNLEGLSFKFRYDPEVWLLPSPDLIE